MSVKSAPISRPRANSRSSTRFSGLASLLLCASACDASDLEAVEAEFRNGGVVPAWQKGPELPTHFVERFMSLGQATPIKARVEDTHQPGSTTTGGGAHVQGLAWAPGGTWAITHSQPSYSDQSLLVLCEDPSTATGDGQGCYHHDIGEDDHHGGGGTQIVGGVLLTSGEEAGENAVLYDIRDPANPVELACSIPWTPGGTSGLVWDPINEVHVASFLGDIYESNGAPLDSDDCYFEPTSIELQAWSQGLSQLFFDPYEEKLVAVAGWRNNDQQQELMHQYFELDGATGGVAKVHLEQAGGNRGPSFRWGATLRLSPSDFDVVLAARGLGTDKGMRIGVYETTVATNLVQGVYSFSGGQYHGCFPETFQPWGPALHPDNNWAWNWPVGWETIDAAFFDAGVWTFIKGSQFIQKVHGHTAVGSAHPISELASNWPASWDRVDAAVRHDNGAIYFFRDTQYLRYDPVSDTIGSWYLQAPRSIAGNFASGWPAWDHVDAAVNGGDGFVYFIHNGQTLAYDMNTAVASLQWDAFSCSFGGHADAMTSR